MEQQKEGSLQTAVRFKGALRASTSVGKDKLPGPDP